MRRISTDFLRILRLFAFVTPILGSVTSAQAANTCQAIFAPSARAAKSTPEQDWQLASASVRHILGQVRGSEPFVHALLTVMIARNFAWFNGDPGGAKTLLSRMMFKAALKSIPDKEKRDFVIQFHKLMQDGIITGFPIIKDLLEKGKYEVNTESSLVSEKVLFLVADEAEKANDGVLSSLLSVLNERKAFLGARVVDAALSSGVFTSNKTIGEFLESFGDARPTGEAIVDRMATKLNMPNQTATAAEKVDLYQAVEALRNGSLSANLPPLPLSMLQKLFSRVEIHPDVYSDIADLALSFAAHSVPNADKAEQARRLGDESVRPYFPANQFSTRSMATSLSILKAAFLAEQLIENRPLNQLRLQVTRSDVHLLATSFIYGSASRIRPKRISVGPLTGLSNGIPEDQLQGQWDPYRARLFVENPLNRIRTILSLDRATGKFSAVLDESQGRLSVDTSGLLERLLAAEKQANVNLSVVEYELDGALQALLAKKTLPKRTRGEFEIIKGDADLFTGLLNAQSVKSARAVDTSEARSSVFKKLSENATQIKNRMRTKRNAPGELTALYFESTREAYNELVLKFPGSEHYIKAIITALAASNHVYAFGGPGGAKTLIARLMLDAEVASANKREMFEFANKFLKTLARNDPSALTKMMAEFRKRDPVEFEEFFLQFHKLLPEGIIIGFSEMQRQIDTGVVKMNFDGSLAAKKFMVAILDEVDKANPAVLTSLLSVLNEREVFAGSTVFKAGLVTAVLTSNKLPSELLDSFGTKERTNGEAVFDRIMNKVYVAHKFIESADLAQFLYDIDHGMSPKLETPFSVSILQPIAKQVEIPKDVLTILASIHEKYMAGRLTEGEATYEAHAQNGKLYPNYYLQAASSSNRTWIALLDQFKARIVVEQMLSGVPIDKLRKTAQLGDLAYFFEGMGYWGPVKIKSEYDAQGLLHLSADNTQIDAKIGAPHISQREKSFLKDIASEARDFVSITNEIMQTFVLDYRSTIAQFPHLFPTLFGSEEARQKWISSNGKPKTDRNDDASGKEKSAKKAKTKSGKSS